MRCIVYLLAFAGLLVLLGGLHNQPSQTYAQPKGEAREDNAAIAKSAQAYADAFNKGDAKAVAAMWTANGECREANGRTFIGRDEIEKAYAAFFKTNPGLKIEVLVKSVRFPARGMAIEEGMIRQSSGAKNLPSTSAYETVHVLADGQWKIALSIEGNGRQDRLEDLEWLLGDWTTKTREADIRFSFKAEPKKSHIVGTFTRTPTGKEPVSGSIRISLDPETGHIRSWGFEDDGAHSQSLWHSDGKSWILDQRGVLADGTSFGERIILQRVSADVISWRAVDRVIGDQKLPDVVPLRLTRTPSK